MYKTVSFGIAIRMKNSWIELYVYHRPHS